MKKLFILLLFIPFAGISQPDSSASLRSSIVRAALIQCDKCSNVATELNFATNNSKEAAKIFYDDGWRNVRGLIYCGECSVATPAAKSVSNVKWYLYEGMTWLVPTSVPKPVGNDLTNWVTGNLHLSTSKISVHRELSDLLMSKGYSDWDEVPEKLFLHVDAALPVSHDEYFFHLEPSTLLKRVKDGEIITTRWDDTPEAQAGKLATELVQSFYDLQGEKAGGAEWKIAQDMAVYCVRQLKKLSKNHEFLNLVIKSIKAYAFD